MLPRQEELEENCSLPEERRLGLLSVTAVQPLMKLCMSANTFLERFISTLWHSGSLVAPLSGRPNGADLASVCLIHCASLVKSRRHRHSCFCMPLNIHCGNAQLCWEAQIILSDMMVFML